MEKLTLETIKEGDIFYDVNSLSAKKISKYRYVCVFPYKSTNNYHLLIKDNDYPVRVYVDSLRVMLDNNIRTYPEGRSELIKQLKESVEFWENIQNKKSSNDG